MRDTGKNVFFLGLVALGSATPIITRRSNTSTIEWTTCTDDVPAGIECGQLEVPMDYSNPNGTTITLGLARLPANGTDKLGSLFLNPGGPGGSGISLLEGQAIDGVEVSREVREQYDLIGTDPRGVGASTPVTCNATIGGQRVNPYPTSEADYKQLVAYNKALGESCANLTGPLINFVDTISAARDCKCILSSFYHLVLDISESLYLPTNTKSSVDLIREALGESTLNWLGFSYGTQLGSQVSG